MIKKLLTTLVIGLGFSTTATLAVEYQSPRVLGMGGSGRAAPILTDSIYLNPSFSSFVQTYSLSGSYLWFDQGRNYNVSIQDSRTEMFQAGLGFTRREQGAAFNIGASKEVVDRLGIGLGSKILIDDLTHETTMNMMFSSSFIANDWMYASLIIDNLFETDNSKLHGLYRNFYVAFKFNPLKEIGVFIDPIYTPNYVGGNKSGFSAGFEFALLADFYLRMGKFVDAEVTYINTRGDGWGLGVGWLGPKVNFEFALHRVTSDHNASGLHTAHTTAMTIFF